MHRTLVLEPRILQILHPTRLKLIKLQILQVATRRPQTQLLIQLHLQLIRPIVAQPALTKPLNQTLLRIKQQILRNPTIILKRMPQRILLLRMPQMEQLVVTRLPIVVQATQLMELRQIILIRLVSHGKSTIRLVKVALIRVIQQVILLQQILPLTHQLVLKVMPPTLQMLLQTQLV